MGNILDKYGYKDGLEYNLYSFDIFDTLITRRTAIPKGIFAIIQEKLKNNKQYCNLPSNIINNFYILRTNAEMYLRKLKSLDDVLEVTIEQIYDFLAKNYALSQDEKKMLLNLELETEIANIIPITENINLLKEIINNGKRVVLISDMYLPSDFIRSILCKFDSVFNDIKIYCSSDILKTKSSRLLYEYVKDVENIEYSKWIHFGDNKVTDIKNAKSLGIDTVFLNKCKLEEYEKYVLKRNEADMFVQYTIGTAKNARLFYGNNNEKKELGISLAGPMLFPYVYWLVEQCERRNIDRLYFVARDGYVLKMMTDKVIKKKNLNITTKYIYGSREAWRLPSLTDDNYDIAYIFNEKFVLRTLKDLADKFDCSLDMLYKFIPEKYHNYTKKLNESDIVALKNSLVENPEFKCFILEHNKDKQNLLLQYIKQEFDFSDDNFAIVDLQGSGNTQKALSSLINSFYHKKVTCFYSRITLTTKNKNDKYIDINIEFPNIQYLNMIRELFCRALHGQTVGYKKSNGVIKPILEGDCADLVKWGYEDFIDGISLFCDSYLSMDDYFDYNYTSLKIFLDYYHYILKVQNRKIARLLGSVPFTYFGSDKQGDQCATPYNILDFINPNKRRKPFPMYSLLRSGKVMQFMMKYRLKYMKK